MRQVLVQVWEVQFIFYRSCSGTSNFAKSNTTVGSFGLLKQSLSGGYALEKSNVYANYIHLQSDGFRQNSSYDRKSVHFTKPSKISATGSLSFGSVYQAKGIYSSSINETDFNNSPQKLLPIG
jgi:iron complex outermembrane receptor protein